MIRNVAIAPHHRMFLDAQRYGYVPSDATYIQHYDQMFGFESNRLVIWVLTLPKIGTTPIPQEILAQVRLHRHQGALVHMVEMP